MDRVFDSVETSTSKIESLIADSSYNKSLEELSQNSKALVEKLDSVISKVKVVSS